jgi:hypothetical protein
MERIIILAIRLDATDIADIAFDRILISASRVDSKDQSVTAGLIATALDNVEIKFPRSQMPQILSDRIKKKLAQWMLDR